MKGGSINTLVMCTEIISISNKQQLIIPAAQKIVKNGRMPWNFWVPESYIFQCVSHGTNACFFFKIPHCYPLASDSKLGQFLGC